VQVEGIELAWTIPVVRENAPEATVVYDAHNAEALLQARSGSADLDNVQRWPAAAYSWLQRRRLVGYETWVLEAADAITAVSETDREALGKLVPDRIGMISVIPNSIDIDKYGAGETMDEQRGNDRGSIDVLFSGKMDYRPNVDAVLWFAGEVWPLIQKERPETTWTIAGQKPHGRLDALRNKRGVSITGWVPEIMPYLSTAKCVIMPFRIGSGTRLKLIEALAAGKGVVSTSVGVEGFPVENGREVLLADSAQEFAELVLRVLEDSDLRHDLGGRGREFVDKYDWRNVVPKFDDVYMRARAAEGRE
jgi:glycosyltransferase involved in cell wall biosynthesis